VSFDPNIESDAGQRRQTDHGVPDAGKSKFPVTFSEENQEQPAASDNHHNNGEKFQEVREHGLRVKYR